LEILAYKANMDLYVILRKKVLKNEHEKKMDYRNVDKYARKLIKIIAPPEGGKNVFQNRYLMLNIFSFFQSGWCVKNGKSLFLYYDIFGLLVEVNQVSNRITNPYHDRGVNQEMKRNSYYVGPVLRWVSTSP
jgi:hypothetical protein